MIGNDIVDLKLAAKESNWRRKGYLDKIFSKREQVIILSSENPEVMVWNLWSRKEAAYKIYNRLTGIRKLNPIDFECFEMELLIGKVICVDVIFYTKTKITKQFVSTVSVLNPSDFDKVSKINPKGVYKINGIPFYMDFFKNIKPASISHHGRFTERFSIV
jgi:phosphopantetheinyl transferase (holo-ACP synthase)